MMLGLNGEGFTGVGTGRGEGARQAVCAQAATANSRNHGTQSSGEEETFRHLPASVHNLSDLEQYTLNLSAFKFLHL